MSNGLDGAVVARLEARAFGPRLRITWGTVGCVALFAAGALLFFFQLGGKTLWNDEAFSFWATRGGVAGTLRFIGDDAQPAFYYLVLHFWTAFGIGHFALRSLSALAMAVALVPLYFATRALLGPLVAMLAVAVFALDANTIFWAQKARPYALQTLFVAITYWGFARICVDPAARTTVLRSPLRGNGGQGWRIFAHVDLAWIAYCVGGALAMLTQLPAGFFLLGCNAGAAILIFSDIRRNRALLVNWTIAQLVLIAIWLAASPGLFEQIMGHLTPQQIAVKHKNYLMEWPSLRDGAINLLTVPTLWRAQLPFALLYAVLVGLGTWRLVRRGAAGIAVLAPVFVPLITCFVLFALVHPIFGYLIVNTFEWLMLPYAVILATGLLAVRPVWLRAGAGALFLLGGVWGARNYYEAPHVPLDAAAAVLKANAVDGDGVILSVNSSLRWGLAYYLGGEASARLHGLDISHIGRDLLLNDPPQALANQRDWIATPEGEGPMIPIDTLTPPMHRSFEQRVGPLTILRLDRGP